MARAIIVPKELSRVNEAMTPVATASLFVAVDAAAGAEFSAHGRDDKTLIVVQNSASAAKVLTVKAGNGIQGVTDLSVSVPASSTTALVLDSGRYKVVSGEDSGKVLLTGESADLKLAVFVLP